jgi:hypothetical protein
LTANTQYVLFFTTSRDNNSGVTQNGFVGTTGSTDNYVGGNMVYINDNGDPTQWTAAQWGSYPGCIDDLGFTATFSSPLPTSTAQCMNGGWKTYGFKNQGQCVSFVQTGKNPPSGL